MDSLWKTMIGLITGSDAQNGYYELTIRIVKICTTIVTSMGIVMAPRIASRLSQKDDEGVRRYLEKSYRFVWMIGTPMAFGIFAISQNFVPWFFGGDCLEVIPIMRVLSFLAIAIGCSNVSATQLLIPAKKESIFTIVAFVAAATNVACNFLLIPRFLALGAAIASLVAESLIAIVLLFFVKKYVSVKQVLLSSLKYLVSAFVMGKTILTLGESLQPSLSNTLLLVGLGVIIYFGMLLMLMDSFLLEYIDIYWKKMFKKGGQ